MPRCKAMFYVREGELKQTDDDEGDKETKERPVHNRTHARTHARKRACTHARTAAQRITLLGAVFGEMALYIGSSSGIADGRV